MSRNKSSLRLATSLLVYMVCSMCYGLTVRAEEKSRWTKISSSRDGKNLRNTFPFSQTADHHQHHQHHGHDTSSSRDSSFGQSIPGQRFSPPSLDDRASRQRGTGDDNDFSLDKADIQAAGERCIDKVIMVQETEYDDVITCKHSYSEKCHTTYSTDYTPQQEEKCEENFKKNCFIEFKNAASEEKVQFCFTPLVKNCDTPGPIECSTEYQSSCVTRYHAHDVEDDVVDCVDEVEEKCESKTQGYSTSEECTKWPVQKCSLEKKQTQKFSPQTECKKVPFELCGPGACPVEPGPEECQERTQTVVIEVPKETCNLEPQRICKHVTKLVPHLKAIENCIDIPKEVCSRSRTNPRKVDKPIVKKWCYGSITPRKPTTKRPTRPTKRPTRPTTKRPTRPTRSGTTPKINKNGSQTPRTKKPLTPNEMKKKRCKDKTRGRCDVRKIFLDGRLDINVVNCTPACRVKECGWKGGECPKPTPPPGYLPPKNGY